mmetsp:Transcript_797/g.1605  ORF Transcript_797/g.1605 Transcript_797/m.1605 type:complete len:81 (+) Transcript_797:124-366(+)
MMTRHQCVCGCLLWGILKALGTRGGCSYQQQARLEWSEMLRACHVVVDDDDDDDDAPIYHSTNEESVTGRMFLIGWASES